MDNQVRVEDQPARERTDLLTMIGELRQRHLFRIAAAYAVVAWLIIQIVATIGPAFALPAWVLRAVILAAIVGFLGTMGVLLFRPRREGRLTGAYLSRRTRLLAGGGVFLVALVAGALSINSLRAKPEVIVAVLPFTDLSPGRDQAYFAEGVGEEILSTLGSENGFRVLGRTSARQIGDKPDPDALRDKLGVTHFLEGSARTAGNALRVNVRLVATSDGSQMWQEEYHGGLADIFKVQDQIAATVVKRLRGTFAPALGTAASASASFDSYQTYLAARALMRDRGQKQLREALVLAQRLVAADPRYAPGQALLAELFYMLSDAGTAYGDMPLEQARRLALPHAREAIRLAPAKPEGYAALGLISQPDRAVAPLQRAIALDPSRAELRIWLGIALTALGRNDEAFVQYRTAADVEPLWPVAINRLTQTLAASGRHDDAGATVRQYLERGGSQAQALRFTGFLQRARGDMSGAIKAERAALARDKTLPYSASWLARQYFMLGMRDEALAIDQGRGEWRYRRSWFGGDRAETRRLVVSDLSKVWASFDSNEALFALGALRDWPAIARLHAIRPASAGDICHAAGVSLPLTIIALREIGQTAQSRRLSACMGKRIASERAMTMRAPDDDPGRLEMRQAALLAMAGDRTALAWLGKAVDRGWVGQNFSTRLADWPQFDALRSDPRYAQLQRRIDAHIARERRQTLALR
ncbi:MAG: hypothetical protein ABIS38_07325 [Sphingomicrobium sp.]